MSQKNAQSIMYQSTSKKPAEKIEIKTCLDRWADIEPNKCRCEKLSFFESENQYKLKYSFPIIGSFFSMEPGSIERNLLDRTDAIIIQGAVQEAIEDRNWAWTLIMCDAQYSAFIHRADGPVSTQTSNTPETALLKTYLKNLLDAV